MKCVIAGSRTITNYFVVATAIAESGWQGEITEVACGMAKGADLLGKQWADYAKIPVVRFPADWRTHGKAAGPVRNEQMANYADALILVWDGKSKGSADMLRKARAHGLRIYEYIVEGA